MATLWTEDDREQLRCAILKKATGQRLTSVDLGGRMESYADASLDQLRALYAEITNDVVTPRPMILRTRFAKGL